jgi:hypothetical protein
MKTLGYIITDRKIANIEGFVMQVKDISEADTTKPILIVGWDNAKANDGYKSILERRLGDGVFWTFKKSEGRSEFEQDLNLFYKYIFNNILSRVKYYYINILSLGYNKLKKLYNIFNSNERKYIYISNNVLYTMYGEDIIGVSLDILEYCGIKRDKVLSLLSSNPNNKIIDDASRIVIKYRKYLGNKKYAVPYFMSG